METKYDQVQICDIFTDRQPDERNTNDILNNPRLISFHKGTEFPPYEGKRSRLSKKEKDHLKKIENHLTTALTTSSKRNQGQFPNDMTAETKDADINHKVVIQKDESVFHRLIYGLTESPPLPLLILFSLQHTMLAISTPLGTSILVAKAVCAENEEDLKTRLMCSTMLMMGVATFCMATIGVRLPIFQGPNAMYIIPLLAMMSLPEFHCPDTVTMVDPMDNTTKLMAKLDNNTFVPNHDVAIDRVNLFSGSLIAAGTLHFLTGALGLAAILGRIIGPITIVPAVVLFGIAMHTVVVSFAESNWPVALVTSSTAFVFAIYLGKRKAPLPSWSRSRGFYILWYPIHQILSLLLGIAAGWVLSYIMTEAGALSNDPENVEYFARTDARSQMIEKARWFNVPYPGQFGTARFNLGAFITFLVATLLSVVDSIGDYSATAKAVSAPRPPSYALNRGVAIEGFMSIVAGFMGCGHATCSYSEGIGAITLSRVASRRVFQIVGIFYTVMAFLSKFGAIFLTIPNAVIGGSQIITFGILIGVVLSYLASIDLNSSRNLSIIGISILMGLCVPAWTIVNTDKINTGNDDLDNAITVLASNAPFVGAFLACVLDNTVPGSLHERGIAPTTGDKTDQYPCANGVDVYRVRGIPDWIRTSTFNRWFPLFDNKLS